MSATVPGSPEDAPRWQELARRAAERRHADEGNAAVRQLLCFVLDGSPYAVPVERVREILRVRPIIPVPRLPREVRGVISLRGEILEVVDLRLRLNLPAAELQRSSRIVVAQTADGAFAGLLVDGVTEVTAVLEDALRPVAAPEAGNVETLCVREGRFVSLIDVDRVLEFDAER
jgi:purine-binding chemotaxis protein CheW